MFLLVDKPKGITSHDVIDYLRKITGERRIGHAGTLDPNATGLLIVGISRESTKHLGSITKDTAKTYIADILLGATSDTDDSEGVISNSNSDLKPEKSDIEKVIKNFLGEQDQIPPIYSAIKMQGKKAYEVARKGQNIELAARKVVIHSIKLLNFNYPNLQMECEVSAGTYIRSLARDIGEKLGTGGYLKELRRTKIGEYKIESAVELDKLTRDNYKDYLINIVFNT